MKQKIMDAVYKITIWGSLLIQGGALIILASYPFEAGTGEIVAAGIYTWLLAPFAIYNASVCYKFFRQRVVHFKELSLFGKILRSLYLVTSASITLIVVDLVLKLIYDIDLLGL